MIPRPKNTDTMDDVIKMQNEYLKKQQEENFKPAAQAIKMNKGNQKKSLFAQQRNLKRSSDDNKKDQNNEKEVVRDVVERKYDQAMDVDEISSLSIDEDAGFPKPIVINDHQDIPKGKSIFKQIVASTSSEKTQEDITQGIHEENLKVLSQMSHEEIMAEREKLLKSMDSKLVEFLKSKKRNVEQPRVKEPPKVSEPRKTAFVEELPSLQFLKEEKSKNWLNMDVIEPEKLEWTRDVEKMNKVLKPGESYEARFDWKGFLLPYTIEEDKNEQKDDRELYLHGDEVHRPGYTLQELFRLARSTVLQQRVSAINAISGILNIYNQGYYDGILELPISKIFFFLRFALDENTPAIIEVSIKALSYLFYNETDETILDILYETKTGFIQPLMDNSRVNENPGDLNEVSSEELLPKKNLFESNVEDFLDTDVEREKESLNDFHMAEVNLVECLMRTNIIERISYIVIATNPNDNTLLSCLKVLIRIARSRREHAWSILNKRNLMECLVKKYLTPIDSKQEPCYLVLKLSRIIGCYDFSFLGNLKALGVVERAKSYVCTRDDININLLKLQIASFRFLRLYFHCTGDESFNEILMGLRYLLEWHYQHLDFQQENHFIIRSHASALIYLLTGSNMSITFPIFAEIFKMCCCKWFHMACRYGVTEFSQKMLLSSTLDVANYFVVFSTEFFYEFIDEYLMKFLSSSIYHKMEMTLLSTPLFKKIHDRCNVHKPLINIGSIVRRSFKTAPTLIFTQDYSAILIESILTFIDRLGKNESNARNVEYYTKLSAKFFSGNIEIYMREFSEIKKRPTLAANWFMRTEIKLIYKILLSIKSHSSYSLKMILNLINCITCDNYEMVLILFDEFLFNNNYYGNDVNKDELEEWKIIFNGVINSKITANNNEDMEYLAAIKKWNQIILDRTWTYSLLMILFYNAEINPETTRVIETELKEKEIILTTLKFNKLLLKNGIRFISNEQELMYLMLIYFGKDLNFLDDDVKGLIAERVDELKYCQFEFNEKLNYEKSFENLYVMFLDFFQANSYGDKLFSIFLMIPLAQKYDSKWRKLVWSEYAMVLKFITCDENDLNFEEYLNPNETDISLLKSYAIALSSNYLRKDSLPWKIAEHHVKSSKLIKSN